MRWIQKADVKEIALGAAVLGTGGGGDPRVGQLLAELAIDRWGPVRLIHVVDVPSEAWVIPSSGIGAPTVSVEKLPSWREMDDSFDDAEAALGHRAFATMPIEIGGGNSLWPLIVAARRGLALVDADAMGRAFPEAQMVSFALDGMVTRFASLADEKGNRVLIRPADARWEEALARPVVDRMGGSAMICDYPVTGAELRASALGGTVSRAQRIGRALLEPAVHRGDPLRAVLAETDGHLLMRAKIIDLDRVTAAGFVSGSVALAGIDNDRGRTLQIHFQNEFLYAHEQGRTLAVSPDLIALLDRDSARPWTTESLRYGMRVNVVGMPCHPKWRTPAGLATAGPDQFGYAVAYVPVEQLARAAA
jgi:uncharacterized protein